MSWALPMHITMTNWGEFTTEAETEAARFPLKPEHEGRVAAAIEGARRRLGGDSVDGHAIPFRPEPWARVLDALPDHCIERGVITRGDVFAVAADKEAKQAPWRLLVATYVWGYGDHGYGPSRLEKVERETPRDALVTLIGDALQAGQENNAMAAYYGLRGEHPGPVTAKHWGAAFFTKALYFGLRNEDPEKSALILDNVMAGQVTKLSDLPHLLYRDKGYNWGSYRYGVYLAWMRQTARAFEMAPELLEYSLFTA
jgi:hypothetical protein